ALMLSFFGSGVPLYPGAVTGAAYAVQASNRHKVRPRCADHRVSHDAPRTANPTERTNRCTRAARRAARVRRACGRARGVRAAPAPARARGGDAPLEPVSFAAAVPASTASPVPSGPLVRGSVVSVTT